MGRFNFLANANDGLLRSSATTIGDAQEGSGGDQIMEVLNNTTVIDAGQKFEPSNGRTYVTEYFQEFSYTTVPASQMVTSAAYLLYGPGHIPSGDAWSLEIRNDPDWDGTALVAGDWASATNLPSLDLLAEFPEIRTISPRPTLYRSGSPTMRARLSSPGTAPLRIVASSNKTRLFFPTSGNGDEWTSVTASETATGSFRPRIEISTATKSVISRAIGAEVQLTDGTVAYLEFAADTLFLRHRTNAGSVTTIPGGGPSSSISIGLDLYQFGLRDGLGAFSLTRDEADNLYVVGPSGAVANGICAAAWVKGGGYSWSSKFGLPHQLPNYDEQVNQVTTAWHQVGGAAGYLAVVAAHAQGYTQTNQAVFCTISAQTLLNNNDVLPPGSLVTAQRDIVSGFAGAPVNAAGTGLDIAAIAGGRGVIAGMTFDHGQNPSSENRGDFSVYVYTIASNGQITSAPNRQVQFDTAGQLKQDGDVRAKVMRVSDARFAVYVGGILGSYGINSSGVVSSTGSNPWLMNSGGIGGLVAFPQVLDGSACAWASDAIYDSATGKVWVYYVDQANSRRIVRTGFNVNSGLLDLTEVQVATNTGASGSSNLRLRLPRGSVDERNVQVHLGNLAGDAVTHTLVHLNDTGLNQVPNAPVLNPVVTFNAAASKLVSWVFSDPNSRDQQSAYQIQIRDQSSGTLVYDSGKVATANHATSFTIAASTLSNNETYEWRVRTYDNNDTVSPYSAYAAFDTTETGVVTITDPATDNPFGLVSPNLTVTWTFSAGSGATQARYRVSVIRVDSGVSLLDTGFISSVDTRSFTINGLISDVEQQIEVRVEDSAGLLSNTGIRRVTPVFSGPDAPLILVQPNADNSGVQITVQNPDPTGDLPAANLNEIHRSPAGANTFIRIGESFPNDVFTDYGAASGKLYDYKVKAVAQGKTDSAITEDIVITFVGVYIHNPLDAAGTITWLPLGGTSKSESVTASGTQLSFVGRTFPVFEFGEQQTESVTVTIQLFYNEPDFGDGKAQLDFLRSVARSGVVHCYRDGRGRKVFGVVTNIDITDIAGDGHEVNLTVTRTDYSEELV